MNRSREKGKITYAGMTFSPKQWEEVCGIKASTIISRRLLGWDAKRIFETPILRPKEQRDAETLILEELARRQKEREQNCGGLEG